MQMARMRWDLVRARDRVRSSREDETATRLLTIGGMYRVAVRGEDGRFRVLCGIPDEGAARKYAKAKARERGGEVLLFPPGYKDPPERFQPPNPRPVWLVCDERSKVTGVFTSLAEAAENGHARQAAGASDVRIRSPSGQVIIFF